VRRVLYEQVLPSLPVGLRAALRTIGPLRRLVEQSDPRLDSHYVWAMDGPLAGYRMHLLPGPHLQYITGPYEPRVCAAIRRLVRPGDVCADVGANIGYMTLLMASATGAQGRVVAFEALPDNVALLRENIALNHLDDRVRVVHGAVSDGSLNRVFLYEGNSTFEFSLLPRPGHSGGLEVSTVTIDNIFPQGQPLHFMKFDIEGAEGEALVGMRRVLREQRPVCLLEIMPENSQVIADEVGAADYVFTNLEGHSCEPPFDRGATPHIIAWPPARAPRLAGGVLDA
jgi:FkbM family methyltransferase